MTRVFPDPAPARISTGPSTASTASRCCGFSLSSNCCKENFRRFLMSLVREELDSVSSVIAVGRRKRSPEEAQHTTTSSWRQGLMENCDPDSATYVEAGASSCKVDSAGFSVRHLRWGEERETSMAAPFRSKVLRWVIGF